MTEQPQDFEGDDNDPVIPSTDLPGQRPLLPLPGGKPCIPPQTRQRRSEG